MLLGIVLIIGGLCSLMVIERIFPDRKLEYVPNWWFRVLTINLLQLAIVVTAAYTWEKWLQIPGIFNLRDYISPCVGGLLAYFINTWIFYWFHRARHEIYLLWVFLHQVHHSPQRIEAITSFYKHPLEILVDSVLMTILLFPILGLQKEASIWLAIPSAYGEYFYHMNIKTPRWIGYLFQRPQSHRIHHLRNKIETCKNYSDFPIWDILGNTFENPVNDTVPTGFETTNETRLADMLMFKDVLQTPTSKQRSFGINFTNILCILLLGIGMLQPMGYLFDNPKMRGLGLITVASPCPLVFSAYNGVETYSTSFHINLFKEMDKEIDHSLEVTKEFYSLIEGPYNRRNIIGVLFSHSAFFKDPKLIKLRDHLLNYLICHDGLDLKRYLPNIQNISYAEISVHSNTQNQTWEIPVHCISDKKNEK